MAKFVVDEKEKKLILCSGGGMFSWCSTKLDNVSHYHRVYNELPEIIDGVHAFGQYKRKEDAKKDITEHFFEESNELFTFVGKSNFHFNMQFSEYKNLDFSSYLPFVNKYYNPSELIRNKINELEKKYKIDYKKTILVYYRGKDKVSETHIASQEIFFKKISECLENNPEFNIVCLTDEITFEQRLLDIYKEKVTIVSEVSENMYDSDNRKLNARNYVHGLYLVASVFMLQKCNTIICGSGNVSLWMILFRGNCNNVHQNLRLKWL